jgi:hypothetical protein
LGSLSELGPQGQDPEIDEVILEVMEKKVVNLVVDQAADLNVIMFDCGLGAGAYPVWLGRTAAGEPACLSPISSCSPSTAQGQSPTDQRQRTSSSTRPS